MVRSYTGNTEIKPNLKHVCRSIHHRITFKSRIMNARDKKKIIRLLAMQIDAHVDGDTKYSDKILGYTETFLTLGELMISVQRVTNLIKS